MPVLTCTKLLLAISNTQLCHYQSSHRLSLHRFSSAATKYELAGIPRAKINNLVDPPTHIKPKPAPIPQLHLLLTPSQTAFHTDPTPTTKMPSSILSRKTDILYLIFFLIHIPVMFCKHPSSPFPNPPPNHKSLNTGVDLTPLYPLHLKPEFMTTLRTWYIQTYRDQFFVSPPAWFDLYMYMELIYHVPLSFWAVGALLRGM